MKTKDIKNRAADILYDNWGQAFIIPLIIFIINIIFSLAEASCYSYLKLRGLIENYNLLALAENKYLLTISIIRIIISFIIISPIYIGAVWWYLHCTRGEKSSIKSIFVCYSDINIFIKTIELKLMVNLIKFAAALPVCIFIFIQYRLINYSLNRGIHSGLIVLLIGCCAVFSFCLICLYIMFYLRFTLTDYIFVLNPDLKIMDIIKSSYKKMKNNEFKIIQLVLSFLMWLPSCILIFPTLFVIPYYAMAFTVMINDIIEKNFDEKKMLLLDRGPASIIPE